MSQMGPGRESPQPTRVGRSAGRVIGHGSRRACVEPGWGIAGPRAAGPESPDQVPPDREPPDREPPDQVPPGGEPPSGPLVGLHNNPMSYAGQVIIIVGLLLILAALAWQLSVGPGSPYLGILAFVVFPGIVFIGIFLFLWGGRRESARRRKDPTRVSAAYPRLDLNDPHLRRRFTVVIVVFISGLALLAFVAYNAFLFTESVTFCADICHSVMEPEGVSHTISPHARVGCVACHVGTGASWYVRSKLSGVRQLFAVTFNTYPRPIPTPVANLRPARDTCEECHWPQAFLGTITRTLPDYQLDAVNSLQYFTLGLKVGGGLNPAQTGGIHWHVDPSVEVSFVAADEKLQVVPWVRVKRHDGTVDTYVSQDTTATAADLARETQHLMDCLDCHNRATHQFGDPDDLLDDALAGGMLPADLPSLKRVSLQALTARYATEEEARRRIPETIQSFYRTQYPSVAAASAAQIRQATEQVTFIWTHHVFPSMNVQWGTYYNNVGHKQWPGCFRCHDGRHVNQKGELLSRDCALCHTQPQRRIPLTGVPLEWVQPQPDWHPMALTGKHATILCDQCHRPAQRPDPDCATCHGFDPKAPMMRSLGCSCHPAPGQKEPVKDCTGCHPALTGLHTVAAHAKAGCQRCHPPHRWIPGREQCLACHPQMRRPASLPAPLRAPHSGNQLCQECHSFALGEHALSPLGRRWWPDRYPQGYH